MAKKQETLWIDSVEAFYRCPECKASHEVKIQREEGDPPDRVLGVIAYLCECGHGAAIVQTRIKAEVVVSGG